MRDACFVCHRAPARAGGWRCVECQARVDMRRATATLAGMPAPSRWQRRLSPVDTLDQAPEPVAAGWLPYRED